MRAFGTIGLMLLLSSTAWAEGGDAVKAQRTAELEERLEAKRREHVRFRHEHPEAARIELGARICAQTAARDGLKRELREASGTARDELRRAVAAADDGLRALRRDAAAKKVEPTRCSDAFAAKLAACMNAVSDKERFPDDSACRDRRVQLYLADLELEEDAAP